jgi:hypothetical protein
MVWERKRSLGARCSRSCLHYRIHTPGTVVLRMSPRGLAEWQILPLPRTIYTSIHVLTGLNPNPSVKSPASDASDLLLFFWATSSCSLIRSRYFSHDFALNSFGSIRPLRPVAHKSIIGPFSMTLCSVEPSCRSSLCIFSTSASPRNVFNGLVM